MYILVEIYGRQRKLDARERAWVNRLPFSALATVFTTGRRAVSGNERVVCYRR